MSAPLRVAVVDDDREMARVVADLLHDEGFEVSQFSSAPEALLRFRSEPPQILITDHRMKDMDGLTLLRRVRQEYPSIVSVMMTAFGSIEMAIEAMRVGAYHYLVKPFSNDDFVRLVSRAAGEARGAPAPISASFRHEPASPPGAIVGESQVMASIQGLVRLVATASANVLVSGESGSGKELVARALHFWGPRAGKPFVAVNCAALPEHLLESELFGHVKGAFTGAVADKKGLFEEAGEGTLFLDEIGDMPPALQAKLLRVLQERQVRPVGGNRLKRIDARIISATHRDLKAMVKTEKFREDLYYRLNVIPIRVPSLRERAQDIPVLVEHFIRTIAARNRVRVSRIHPEALKALIAHTWPGNVRELENVIERAVVLSDGDIIGRDSIILGPMDDRPGAFEQMTDDRPSLAVLEERYINRILRDVGYNKGEAARILGVSRRTLYRRERLHEPGPRDSLGAPNDQAW